MTMIAKNPMPKPADPDEIHEEWFTKFWSTLNIDEKLEYMKQLEEAENNGKRD